MEKLCARVRAEDAAALEALVKPVRDRASAAAQDFLLLHSSLVSQPPPPPAAQPSSSSHNDDNVDEEPVSDRQIQLHLPEIPADESAAESWDNLEEVRPEQAVWISYSILGIFRFKVFLFRVNSNCSKEPLLLNALQHIVFILLLGQALLKSCLHVYSTSVFLSLFHVIMNKVGEFIISAQLFFFFFLAL